MSPASDKPRLLVLLDQGASWQGAAGKIAHWAELEVPAGHDSVPLWVTEQTLRLRQEYLAWVHDLGEYRIKNRTLKDHLRLSDGFSFWWMTLIAGKDPYASIIYTIFKLRALELLYLSSDCQGIVLCSSNPVLDAVLSDWCRRLGHSYCWRRTRSTRNPSPFKERLRRLPLAFQALFTLARRLTRLRARLGAGSPPPGGRQGSVVTYFPNIDRHKAQAGIFRSQYWGELHDLLDRGPWTVNWIWYYVPGGEYSFSESLKLRKRFQRQARGRAHFHFLEEYLTLGALGRALALYARLQFLRPRLKDLREAFHFPDSLLNFWPFLARDWQKSLSGPGAMDACLTLKAFQALATRLPHQDWGLYLWENIPWERALNWAWQDAKHGRLLAFQHVSQRLLDLRSFEDPRSYQLEADGPPLPDRLLVNGAGPWELFVDSGFPPERLTMVEALRQSHLRAAATEGQGHQCTPKSRDRNGCVLLVVTGSFIDETKAQLRLLDQVASARQLHGFEKILVKPHPDVPVDRIMPEVAPHLRATVVSEPLPRLWPLAAVVYTANSTTASIEAALMGLPVLVHVVEGSLNFSPLLGQAGVTHVATVAELSQGLAAPPQAVIRTDYFCLEQGLPRWRNLLALQGNGQQLGA